MIIGSILGSIFWGALIAIAVTAGVYIVCRCVSAGSVRGLSVYAILGVLFVLEGAQGTMMAGAGYVKDYVDDVRGAVTALLPQDIDLSQVDDPVAAFDELRRDLGEEYPLLKPYLDKIDAGSVREYMGRMGGVASGGAAVADFVVQQLNDMLDAYRLRRVLWMLGLALVSLVGVLFLSRGSGLGGGYSATGSYDGGGATLQF